MDESENPPASDRRSRGRLPGLHGPARVGFGLFRWIRAHVSGFYGAVGTFLVMGLGIAVGAALLFGGVASLMAAGATQTFDDAVLLWLNRYASESLDVAALEITALGSGASVWMVVLVGSVFLWATRHQYSAALLWVAALGSSIVSSTLKYSFDRPRPQLFEWRTDYAGLSSFPSGHATTAMVVYATLTYLVIRLEPTRRLRRLTIAIAVVVVLLIGVTRLYLGVHYPSDVIAGYLVGAVWAAVCALGIEAVRYFRDRNPEAPRHEADLDRDALGEAGRAGD
jgi:undecaprenyl-diphosphatase